jgi:hypothetical protein
VWLIILGVSLVHTSGIKFTCIGKITLSDIDIKNEVVETGLHPLTSGSSYLTQYHFTNAS